MILKVFTLFFFVFLFDGVYIQNARLFYRSKHTRLMFRIANIDMKSTLMRLPTIFTRGLRTHPFLNTQEYFEYARTKQLKTNSTVFSGTSFELAAMKELTQCLSGLKLRHVGGANDNGIDLTGQWSFNKYKPREGLPNKVDIHGDEIIPVLNQASKHLNVLVQCKNYSTKITPKEIRELPGIFHGEFNQINAKNSIMLFCAPNVLTKNGIQQLITANIPIGFCQISRLIQVNKGDIYDLDNYKGGHLVNFLANPQLQALLEGTTCIQKIEKRIAKNNSL